MQIEVIGLEQTTDSTLSKMMLDGNYFAFVIEDGYRKVKEMHKTRIPDGVYKVVKRTRGGFFERYRRQYGHKFALELQDVPGFYDVLIHAGNYVGDTSGCLLVNRWAGFDGMKQVFEGKESVPMYRELYKRIEAAMEAGETITIALRRDQLNAVENAPSTR